MKPEKFEQETIPLEDINNAIYEGRSLKKANLYRIILLNDHLTEQNLDILDPIPTGRQILRAAQIQHVENYSLYAFLSNGDFEEVSPDETFDIRGRGAQRFIIFETDRAFKFVLNEHHLEWGYSFISGKILKLLAKVDPEENGVWLVQRDHGDRLISDIDIIDLSQAGVEKLYTDTLITIFVNTKKKEIKKTQLTFQEVVRLAFPEAVFNDTRAYTVTFKRGYGNRPEGSMVEGNVIRVKNGEVFNVTATDKS